MKRFIVAPFALAVAIAPTPAEAVGELAFVDHFEPIPNEVLQTVATVMPESSAVGQAYLSEVYDPNLLLTEAATVRITFVHEGAGYRNSLGYFTYVDDGTGPTIVDSQLIFPNASYADPNLGWGGGSLEAGDTVTLRDASGAIRTFAPGERIGFFLVSNGWNGASVSGWSGPGSLPSVSPGANAGHGNGLYTTIDPLNPEMDLNASLSRHVAMVSMDGIQPFLNGAGFYLVGFEDLRRTAGSDEDFNDLVVIASASPETAIATTNVQAYTANDADGDGVVGLQDYFPNDPDRATVIRTPAAGLSSVAFEDNYPNVGDADYNDAVVRLVVEEVLDAQGDVVDLAGTFHLVARGASLDHAFGINIPGMPPEASGTVSIERFDATGVSTSVEVTSLASRLQPALDGTVHLRIDDVFPSTQAALPAMNTLDLDPASPPASARVVVAFDAPIERAPLGLAPFDPFLLVQRSDGPYDVHLPGKLPFFGRPAGLPLEDGVPSFVDASFHPFAMLVPDDWRFPLEKVDVHQAYPIFSQWRSSLGQLGASWYLSPEEVAGVVIAPVGNPYHDRPWTLRPGL